MIEVFNRDPVGWTVVALILAYDIGMLGWIAFDMWKDRKQ